MVDDTAPASGPDRTGDAATDDASETPGTAGQLLRLRPVQVVLASTALAAR